MEKNPNAVTRREALARAALIAGAAVTVGPRLSLAANETPAKPASKDAFIYSLNMGTIRGQKLPLVQEIEVAAKAGFQAIEPWISAIDQHVKNGGSLKDLRQRIQDRGLTVAGAIGFPQWIVDDEERRRKGLEQAKREMDLVAQIGGKRIAAPPAGATNESGLDLFKAAERYRTLLELGDEMGVVPLLEQWGFSKNLNRLGEVAMVAIETGHPRAGVLSDVFHMYKGGSDFNGLRLLSHSAIPVFHINDYPAEPARDQINDSYRVMPGDGVAPLNQILRDLHSTGSGKVLSLELFNRKYWEQDALTVARLGLEKMKTAVREALG